MALDWHKGNPLEFIRDFKYGAGMYDMVPRGTRGSVKEVADAHLVVTLEDHPMGVEEVKIEQRPPMSAIEILSIFAGRRIVAVVPKPQE